MTALAIYNENDPFAAQWTRNLIAAGHVAPGVVDERSIRDLTAADVAGHGQRHFFAGIGVWSYALRLAGVPDDADVWTGSCPCQPFSSAGRKGGFDDERHLWPVWFALIRECRPAIVFGEQVASPDGRMWLDAVYTDLEGADYTVGTAVLCAAGLGAPHLRHRLFFVAYADGVRHEVQRIQLSQRESRSADDETTRSRSASGVAHYIGNGLQGSEPAGTAPGSTRRDSDARRMGNSGGTRSGRDCRSVPRAEAQGSGKRGSALRVADVTVPAGTVGGPWADAEWLDCIDGRIRPVEPSTFPLAHGATARVGRLRAYGNAIVPQVAATFIRAAVMS